MLKIADTTHFPPGHPQVAFGRIGVLLVNLGTPEATDYWSMRRYLKEFLSDPRVIEVNRVVWWLVLNLIVLTKRPGPKGKDYDTIWNKALDEGPLKTITRAQAEKLAAAITREDPRLIVDWAMRYGKPPIAERLEALQKQGCERILIVPLYPQYAAATTATVCDKAFDALKTMRWQPIVRIAPPWHDDPAYIENVCISLEAHLARLDFEPEVILASFHGVPKSYLEKGDPYHCHCMKTGRLMRERLEMSPERFRITFQSRFGTEEWLQPYTDKTVEALAKSGVKRLAIVNPGFTADCLETLEEIGGENREIFLHNGGEKFAAIPCLNDTEEGMRVIETVVRRELSGWMASRT
ncbi:ferrochelatase [Aquabacter spiritensis]|uniref:Ferrochelatase n=1 Tax=Aquabacter spiritensis TaxID=933073 RepID=A0A4R3M1C1_9HYPH|nr:ferrochelatase [Aquabacter spiritensis]TCT06904.1 ferrochelatase [Aquabacter spiritensis]